jgi:hypothetical protein
MEDNKQFGEGLESLGQRLWRQSNCPGARQTFLFNSSLRRFGFRRGLCMARCTQTARAADQDRTSAGAECSIAQTPASEVISVVERKGEE